MYHRSSSVLGITAFIEIIAEIFYKVSKLRVNCPNFTVARAQSSLCPLDPRRK